MRRIVIIGTIINLMWLTLFKISELSFSWIELTVTKWNVEKFLLLIFKEETN